MTARLFCKVGELAGAEFEIGDEATIGRGSANNVVLGTGLVSSRHARIYRDPSRGAYYVEDLGSLNGTRLDGVALGRPERLGDLAVLTFAGVLDFIFQDLDALPRLPRKPAAPEAATGPHTMIEHEPILPPDLLAGTGTRTGAAPARPPTGGTMIEKDVPLLPDALAPEPARTGAEPGRVSPGTRVDDEPIGLPAALAAEPVAPPPTGEGTAGTGPRYVLETPGPEGRVRRLALRPGDNVVGRLGDCDLRLDDPSISRRHAVLTLTGDRVTVRDLGSTNRTHLGDDPVEGEAEVPAGATLRFGSVPATLVVE